MDTKPQLTRYREEQGLTLEALGLLLTPPVNKSTVLRWERHGVPVDRIVDVERATGLARHVLRPDIFDPASIYKEAAE